MDRIEAHLREHCQIPPENRLDIDLIEDDVFHAIEVLPDLSTGRRFSGELTEGNTFSGSGYSISHSQEPDLSLAQLQIYEPIHRDWLEKIERAEGNDEIFLMRDGDHPELFTSLQKRPANIPGNVNEGMEEVWHALDDMLREHGYNVSRREMAGEITEIWTTPLMFP